MAELETIEIVNKDSKSGFTRINVSDFDPKVHKPYGDAIPPEAPAAPVADEGEPVGLGTDSGDDFSDKELCEMIEQETGKRPGGRTSRENLIAQYNALNAAE